MNSSVRSADHIFNYDLRSAEKDADGFEIHVSDKLGRAYLVVNGLIAVP